MISVKKCREILAQDGEELTDEEIIEISRIFEICAKIELEHYLKTNHHEKEGGNIH